jgi:uncharacterized protein YeaO (DUF488 family)
LIRTARISDAPAPSDGTRVLIARHRPRGVAKGDETWDAWDKRLAPSLALLDAFHGKQRAGGKLVASGLPGLGWRDYERKFLEEMKAPEAAAAIEEYALRSAAMETVTLLCYCEDETRCHRGIVRRLISEKQRAL